MNSLATISHIINTEKIVHKLWQIQRVFSTMLLKKVEDDQQMEVTQFQEKMIEIIFGTNMSFSQVEKPYFIELFTFFGVKETDILTQFLLLK